MTQKFQINTKKQGFTLIELLCALAIIGICTALSIAILKPAQKSTLKYLYISAYQALDRAYYNSYVKGFDPFSTLPDENGRTPVFTDTQDTGAKTLCQGLTSFINTTTNVKTKDQDYSSTCSDTKLTSEMADNFDSSKIQFTANNGMNFYISKKLSVEDELEFYLVFVDVNGAQQPNSIEYTYNDEEKTEDAKIEPDIFAFAIHDTGRICPIGIPEYDSNILTARMAYFDSAGDVAYTKKSMPYYQAKGAAWGYYNEGTDDYIYNLDEPYSVNDIIRRAINPNSKIVKDFPVLREKSPVVLSAEAPYNCAVQDFESCYIFLDTYIP